MTGRYTARGLFLDPPTLEMIEGQWCVLPKEDIMAQSRYIPGGERPVTQRFASRDHAFAASRDASYLSSRPNDRTLDDIYSDYIEKQMMVYQVAQLSPEVPQLWTASAPICTMAPAALIQCYPAALPFLALLLDCWPQAQRSTDPAPRSPNS